MVGDDFTRFVNGKLFPYLQSLKQKASGPNTIENKIGETICDPAGGSMGFLCEAFDYLKQTNPKRTTAQDRTLQERTFYGKEKESLAYVIAIMNMIRPTSTRSCLTS